MIRRIRRVYRNIRSNKLIKSIHKSVMKTLSDSGVDMIEYGNIRKTEEWGTREFETIRWIYEIDLISERPMRYRISLNTLNGEFSCYASFGTRTNAHSTLQFTATNPRELARRLKTLAMHIPSLRERAHHALMWISTTTISLIPA